MLRARIASATKSAPKNYKNILLLVPFVLAFVLPFMAGQTKPCVFVISGKGCVFTETVNTPSTRELGLGGRTSMPLNHGMLFVFDRPDNYCFWMKDMKFPLDIIWLDSEKRIVEIKPNLSPATYPHAFCPALVSQYVVEVNAGIANQARLTIGKTLAF